MTARRPKLGSYKLMLPDERTLEWKVRSADGDVTQALKASAQWHEDVAALQRQLAALSETHTLTVREEPQRLDDEGLILWDAFMVIEGPPAVLDPLAFAEGVPLRKERIDLLAVMSPWEEVLEAYEEAPGIVRVHTGGHGGLLVERALYKRMDPVLRKGVTWKDRKGRGWFEEDCQAALVVVAFPELFGADHVRRARESCKQWNGSLYAASQEGSDVD